MLKLFRYLRHYKKESVIGPLFKMLEAFFELLVPILMAKMIDVGIATKDKGYILRIALLLVALGILGLCCSLVAQFFAAKASAGFGTELREDMFSHINRLSYAELDRIGTATLVTRMTSDINQIQQGINMILRLFLRSPFIVLGALVAAFLVSARVGVIFLITTPVLALIIYGIMVVTIPMYEKVQRSLDRLMQKTRESLHGARVIRAFHRQKDETKEFDENCDQLFTAQRRVGRISVLMNPLTYVVVNIAIAGVLLVGGRQVNHGDLTQGEVIALVNYMTQILNALVALQVLIVSFTKAMACARRVNEVFVVEPSVMSPESNVVTKSDSSYSVSFEHVNFTYPGGKEEALTDIHFSVKPGEMIGIIGSTGSGKSTLVNLIPRFYDVTGGHLSVCGRDVKEYDARELRERIGMVPQRAVLFSGSIRDNMRWGKKDATDEEILEALDIAQAREFVEKKEGVLSYHLAQGGKNLSGGQRQRLTIARALVRKPDILILDDSASALDMATDAALRLSIREKTKGMTVFLVSQRTTTIQHADRIVVLEDGEMVAIGTHEELCNTCEIYREIYRSQHGEEESQSTASSVVTDPSGEVTKR